MLGYERFAFWPYLQGVRPINQLISGLDGSAKNAKSRKLTLQGEETDVHLVPPIHISSHVCYLGQNTTRKTFSKNNYLWPFF